MRAMKQNIRFKGLSLTPDEQAVENGALAMSIGVELHNGSLRPSIVAGTTVTNVDGDIIYIHEVSNTAKNVAYAKTVTTTTTKTVTLYWQEMVEGATPIAFGNDVDASTVTGITSNGNTLIMMTTEGLRYFLWSKNTYKYLGERPPMIQLAFKMAPGSSMIKDVVNDNGITWRACATGRPLTPEEKYWPITDEADLTAMQKVSVLGCAYKYFVGDTDYSKKENLTLREDANDAAIGQLSSALLNAGYMYQPFYVRYCYKLWDGTKIMHSAPVLMFTDITYPECVLVYKVGDNSGSGSDHIHEAVLFASKLRYKCLNNDVYEQLKESWKDIVKSIDIYITPGISRYDENNVVKINTSESATTTYPEEAKWHKLTCSDVVSTTTCFRAKYDWAEGNYGWSEKLNKDKVSNMMDNEAGVFVDAVDVFPSRSPSTTSDFYHGLFTLNPLNDADWRKRLLNQDAYYLLSRFVIQEDAAPSAVEDDVKVESGILSNLEAQEAMISDSSPDDYYTHNGIIATTSYLYNSRINLTGITDVLFSGFPVTMLLSDCVTLWSNKLSLDILNETNIVNSKTQTIYNRDKTVRINSITVAVETDAGTKYVKTSFDEKVISLYDIATTFLFYPDSRAKEIWLTGSNDSIYFELAEHPLLNGAYHIGNIGCLTTSSYTRANLPVDIVYDNKYDNRGYIYTSASGNPFVYPAANRYKVGLGDVKAITSVTRAISQGQFGQFPMMAFATDGIYALEVSSSGSYSNVHPISREVITNTNALLQLDQSVAFVTKRGVSRIAGSDVADLSSMLNGVVPDLEAALALDNELLTSLSDGAKNPIKAMQSSKAIYDYSDKRLLFFVQKEGEYTGEILVYSADEGTWTYTVVNDGIRGVFCSYPYPYIHKSDGDLAILDTPYDYTASDTHDGLIITRTLKYDGVRNFISGFLQDYDMDVMRPDLYLWGSNDNRRWHYIGHSNRRQQTRIPGHTYKYFRAAVVFSDMKVNDLYHGIELDIKEKYTK